MRTALLNAFAATALVLAAMGVYSLLSFSVARRTREIGVRMALGAQRSDVVRLVLRQGMKLVVIGVVIGAALAAFASRLIQSLLFGVGAADPIAFGAAAALFFAIGLGACWLPARKATAIEATEALRAE